MESTEQRIRQAALGLFADKGFHATSIRDIANEAGVTTASMYHYMQNKEELLQQIMRDGLNRLIVAADDLLEDREGADAQLAGLVQLHVWVHGNRPLSARVTDTETRSLTGAGRSEIIGLRDAYEARWINTIQRGADSGRFGAANPRLASLAILEMCTGVSHWYSPKGRLPLVDICNEFATMALAMVGSAKVRISAQLPMGLRVDPSVYYRQELSAAPGA
jgi:AcrR family transcriptional regulator